MPAPVCLIVNPAAGGGRAGRLAPSVERALRGHGLQVRRADTRDLEHARDLYTRREEGVSIWVVPSSDITASTPDEKDSFFDPAGDKVYRHPTFYEIPAEVEHL